MSAFTDLLGRLFGTRGTAERSIVLNVVGSTTIAKDYVNNIKTNRKLAREIYHNLNKDYSLGGQLIKPIINNNVNFIGIPTLFGNKKNIKVIEEVNIDYRKIHKGVEIDGSVFLWPQWDNDKKVIKLTIIPIDIITSIFIDPVKKKITGYKLVEKISYSTPEEINQEVEITCIITEDYVKTSVVGSENETIIMRNVFGMIPIVHFSNDRDFDEIYGHSEIESIEPQIKFYHDLTYEAGAAQSRDGHPKLKVTTNSPKQWVENNFGKGTYEKIVSGEAFISMDDRDLFVNGEGEDVNYLYLNKTTGDYGPLSEKTFSNIVEGSETPEINFGANIGTSLASVKEYRPVWIKKIEAKQYERTAPWMEIYDIILMIHNFVNIKSLKNDIIMTWPTPNFASVKEQSEIIDAFSKAIEKLILIGSLTSEEIYDTLMKLGIFELAETYKAHEEVIKEEEEEREKKAKAAATRAKESSDESSEESNENDDEGTKD